MLKMQHLPLSATLALILLIIISGCMGRSLPSRLYTITPISEDEKLSAIGSLVDSATIGIGPIKVADYLNQSRIVTRSGDNRINQAKFDQWSGNFKDNFTNVLAENIGYLLATDRISIYPWRTYMPIDYQVTVDIVRCDGQLGKDVTLVARWSVLSGEKKKLLAMKRSNIIEKIDSDGYEVLVAAHSRALGKLSREIAKAIQTEHRKPKVGK